MIPASLLLLSLAPCAPPQELPPLNSLNVIPYSSTPSTAYEHFETVFHSLFDSTLYFGAGTLLGTGTALSALGGSILHLFPGTVHLGKECYLFSRILGIATVHAFTAVIKKSPFFSFKNIPSSQSTWHQNKKMLSELPSSSTEDKELLRFLQKRFLAKTTGCYSFLVDWMCPAFDIAHQVHPESTNSYARNPSNKLSQTYIRRIQAWKKRLPHPDDFPLILTRNSQIQNYLPCCLEWHPDEEIDHFFERITETLSSHHPHTIVDLTSVLPIETDPKRWIAAWNSCEAAIAQRCEKNHLDTSRLLCIQRMGLKEIGGIRLLPFSNSSKKSIESHHAFLLEWISTFGLSANRIDLDRCFPFFEDDPTETKTAFLTTHIPLSSKTDLLPIFEHIDESWKSENHQKSVMWKGTLNALKDLCESITEEKWAQILESPTRSSAVELSLQKIQERLFLILLQEEKRPFHEIALHLEQVHAHLTALLEIFSPFQLQDFVSIFREHLTCIPKNLQPLTGYGIHSSGMTSLTGIFKAVENMLGKPPRILYGENAYFECIHAAERYSQATSVLKANAEDFQEADLILAQYNPTLKRINFTAEEHKHAEYHVEKIAAVLHKALENRLKPLCIAIDCTFDLSNSFKVGNLLTAFQDQIESGHLNVLCYRSGIKFDLFGMDNYCGAPFFIVHNNDPKWKSFDRLFTDPALQTDPLSLNWFCLAFQRAAPFLEAYRKQYFDNAQALLSKMPQHLFKENNQYRVIPMTPDADCTFIDMKIFGPMHEFRGGVLAGGLFTIQSMHEGFPLLYRPGIGFYHPNISVLFAEECTTIRLTLGLDPAFTDVMVDCMEKIDALNTCERI